MKKLLIMFALLSPAFAMAATHECAKNAIEQAQKLLEFHREADSRIEIDQNVKVLKSMRNPAQPKQVFDVLEVWGYIYKGQYRMRFIYARGLGCLLMGQEILEYARL